VVLTTFTCTIEKKACNSEMASIDLDDMDSDAGDESSSIDQNPAERKHFYGDAAKYWEVTSIWLYVYSCQNMNAVYSMAS
jgi:hypothetical protein